MSRKPCSCLCLAYAATFTGNEPHDAVPSLPSWGSNGSDFPVCFPSSKGGETDTELFCGFSGGNIFPLIHLAGAISSTIAKVFHFCLKISRFFSTSNYLAGVWSSLSQTYLITVERVNLHRVWSRPVGKE